MAPFRIFANATFVADGDRPVTAVAVGGERIIGVGDYDEVRAMLGYNAEVVDLGGATVFPGFSDNHVHVLNFGRSRMGVPCWPSDVVSITEIAGRVRSAHQTREPGHWIRGRGYNPSELAEKRPPTASDLDVDGSRCVVLDSFDFHGRVANHAALAAAGIGPDTPDPDDGEIVRSADGFPTGELLDGARSLLDEVMPPWSAEEDEQAIDIATDHFLSLGFTYVTNAAPLTMSRRGEEVDAFLRLSERGDLRIRFTSMIRHELLEAAADMGLHPGVGGDNFRLEGAKVFADGAFGPRTAFMSSPYTDTGESGSMRIDVSELESIVRRAAEAGWPVCVHATGDAAVGRAAATIEKGGGAPALGHRIEHCCLTSREAIATMVSAKVTPVPQLGFLRYRTADFVAALGEERVARLYPLRSWIDAGLRPLHSSDSPVIADARPMAAAATAIERTDAAGNVFGASEGVTFNEAVAMMTVWPAEHAGLGRERGQIAPGYLSDFTVFSEDPRAMPASELAALTPTRTIVGGEIAWETG